MVVRFHKADGFSNPKVLNTYKLSVKFLLPLPAAGALATVFLMNTFYSFLKCFTGFAMAAFMVWKPIVQKAIDKTIFYQV